MYKVFANDVLFYDSSSDDLNKVLLDPSVTLELGKAGSFEFSLPPSNLAYDMLTPFSTIIVVYYDDTELFRGRVFSINRDFDNNKKVSCEGLMAYLVDSVQKGEDYKGTTRDLFRKIIEKHNSIIGDTNKQFVIGDVTIEDREITVQGTSDKTKKSDGQSDYKQIFINASVGEWKQSYEYITSYITSYVGGYLRVRYEDGVNYIDYLGDEKNGVASQSIEFGKNLLDITVEMSADKLFTVLIPLGDSNLTIESVNDGSPELVNEELVSKYGRIIKTNVFSNCNKAATLLENGQRYLEKNSKLPVTVTVNGVDLHLIYDYVEPIKVGNVVHIKSEPHGIDQDLTSTKIVYKLDDASGNEYVFGDPLADNNLTDVYNTDKTKSGGGGKGDPEQEVFGDFYDAWVRVDKDETGKYKQGTVSIGAIYKKALQQENELSKVRYILDNELGLNFDSPNGKISLTNIQNLVSDAGEKIAEMDSAIHLYNGDRDHLKTSLELVSEMIKHNDDKEEAHFAQYLQTVTDTSAQIDILVGNGRANAKGIHLLSETVDGQQQTLTRIDTDITRIESRITYMNELIAKCVTADQLNAGYTMTGAIRIDNTLHVGGYANFDDAMHVRGINSIFECGILCYKNIWMNGSHLVASQDWVTEQKYATQDWVKGRGYVTAGNVDWETGIRNRPTFIETPLTIDGRRYVLWRANP